MLAITLRTHAHTKPAGLITASVGSRLTVPVAGPTTFVGIPALGAGRKLAKIAYAGDGLLEPATAKLAFTVSPHR